MNGREINELIAHTEKNLDRGNQRAKVVLTTLFIGLGLFLMVLFYGLHLISLYVEVFFEKH